MGSSGSGVGAPAGAAVDDEGSELDADASGGEDEDAGGRLEQQNIVLSTANKAHLARLAGQRGMSLRRYLSEVVVAEHIDNARDDLRQMYLRDVARLEQSMDQLSAPVTTVKRKRKQG